MAQYKINSERFTLGNKGETIDESVLDGANIQALIDGGHLTLATAKKTEDTSEIKDK